MLNERNTAGHVGGVAVTTEYALGFVERALVEAESLVGIVFP
jgi:hypothetical protein